MTESELKHRIRNAIILLTDGHPCKVGDLTFGAINKFHLSVTGWTICNDMKSLTKHNALEELKATKELFNKMLSVSSELRAFSKDRLVEYRLGYDYGMGGLEICVESTGEVKWIAELKE